MSAAVQTAWAELLVASLTTGGVRDVVVSPGSRSTPLVAALLGSGQRLHPVIDERSAGFYALGLARASGRPVALVCTSGSAPAHYLPAVIEASLTALPLIVVSADRPPELHGAGASQTLDQHHLFGGFLRRFDDLGPPDGSALALRGLRRKVIQAVATSRGPWPGPVQLDVPLRKPLEPARPSTADERAAVALAAHLAGAGPQPTAGLVRVPDEAVARAAVTLAAGRRGLIIATAGPIGWRRLRGPMFALARATGWPLWAEAGSQLRFAPRPADLVAVDRLGLVAAAEPELAPDVVLQLGGEPVAMAWPGLLARQPVTRIIVADHGWPDGDSSAEQLLIGEVGSTLERLLVHLTARRPAAELTLAWQRADRAAAAAMTTALANLEPGAAEGAVVAAAIAAVPTGAQLMLGNSLPIRVADDVIDGGRDLTVLTQRGAAGIDGLIAGAAGAAAAGGPTVLVLGDVSFAHDLGSLATARGQPLAIVVIDNHGGRIFDALPAARTLPAADLERLWRTPPGLDPVAIATSFGLDAVRADGPVAVAAAVTLAVANGRATVIHAPVIVDSARRARDHAVAALCASATAAARPPITATPALHPGALR